jgi:hypothetical protein
MMIAIIISMSVTPADLPRVDPVLETARAVVRLIIRLPYFSMYQ